MRYILKKGKFGMYFFDNQTNKDIDLNMTLELLNKLSMINQHLKTNNATIILCKTCSNILKDCCQSKFNLENNITFDYCNDYW